MSYLALARKYRPQTFENIASQQFVTKTLQNAIAMGRVSHAYLFTGPRGVGKTSTARIFAKALNCLNPDGANPCDKCENCLEIINGTSIDVIEIDAASNRGVDEIRSLREAVKFMPVRGKYKIYIIDEVHMLTKEAFNALLKTLEEPPEFVVFIFATTDKNKLPATIISRCQRYEFTKIGYMDMIETMMNVLKAENIEYEEDALNLIVRNSDGGMRDALSILDQVIAYSGGRVDMQSTAYLLGVTDSYLADELFACVLNEDTERLPGIITQMDEKGLDYKFVSEVLIAHTRNMLMFSVTGSIPAKGYTDDEINFYKGLKKQASKERLYAVFQIFLRLLNDIKYFDFERYIFEFALFKAASISNIIPLTASSARMAPQVAPAPEKKAAVKESVKIEIPQAEPVKHIHGGVWDKAIKIIESAGGPFHNNLQYARLLDESAEKITIGFAPEREFYYKYFSKPENRERFDKIFKGIADPAPRIAMILEEVTDEGKKKAQSEPVMMKAKSYKEMKTEQSAEDDPLVKEFIRLTGAEIESIDVLDKK